MPPKAVFNWSGGKDSALALCKVLQSNEYDVVSLLTTINSTSKRSSMHAIPVTLLQAQADSIGIPLYLIEYEPEEEIKGYENCMLNAVNYFIFLRHNFTNFQQTNIQFCLSNDW